MRPDCGILALSNEELNLDFEATIRKISEVLELSHSTIKRPGITESVIGYGTGQVAAYNQYLDHNDLEFVSSEVGDMLNRLKYH